MLDDTNSEEESPRNGLAFRIIVGGVTFVSGAILALWASDQGIAWKYLPAAFCFAVFGIVALPRRLAVACGYMVSVSVLALSAWFLYLGITGKDAFMNSLRFASIYGLPALAFLLYRQIPGRTRRAA